MIDIRFGYLCTYLWKIPDECLYLSCFPASVESVPIKDISKIDYAVMSFLDLPIRCLVLKPIKAFASFPP